MLVSAPVSPRLDADVVIVGAGYAGMVAAYRLFKNHKTVIVFDALKRTGGRSWSAPLSDGGFVDIIAGWTGSTQNYMKALIAELGMETYTQYGVGPDSPSDAVNMFIAADGSKRYYQGQAFPVSDKGKLEIFNAIQLINLLASSIPLDQPWTALDAKEWDATSAGAFAMQYLHDPEAIAVVMNNLQIILGMNPFAASLLHLLWDSQMAGGILQFGAVEGGSVQYRIRGGTQQIPNRIHQILGQDAFRLDSPVREISQDDDGGVTVVSERSTVRAAHVIVAIPTCLTGFIRFKPPLTDDRAQLIQRVPLGSAMKVQFVYDRAFWRSESPKLTGYTFSISSSPVSQTLDSGGPAGEDTPGILACFIDGDAARDLGRLSVEDRRAIILDELAKRFDSQKVRNLSQTITPNYVESISQNVEWFRGDYASTPGPCVLTASGFGPAMRTPFDRIHWAGIDTADKEWYQTLDGAAQSGERAAAAVMAAGLK
jgi:monoamine oxidase